MPGAQWATLEMMSQNVALETRLSDDLLDVSWAARGRMHYE
jgi:hypothetical protein